MAIIPHRTRWAHAAASCSINIEKTDVGQVVESGDLLSVRGPLGAPEGKFTQGSLTVVYHDINLGYATQYNPGGFVRFNALKLREIGLLVLPRFP